MDPGTRRFVSIVVVAMLLLVALLTALTMLPAPNGNDEKGDDEGWEVRDETIVVYADTKWSGWDQVLAHPVVIESGCQLTISECNLEIPLERMVLEDDPPFNVSRWASLVVKNTTIQVTQAPPLGGALFDAYRHEVSTPILWRVVNLIDAVEPFLEMQVEYIRGGPYIVVAVQVTSEDPLVPLAVIDPGEMSPLEWATIEVPLDGYVDTTPRVFVFIHNSTVGEALVSNVSVTDKGGQPPHDEFGSGDVDEDGWVRDSFYSMVDMVDHGNWAINRLIDGRGDLEVRDSRILSLPGLERESDYYRPQGKSVPEGPVKVTPVKAPDQGGINVSGDVVFSSSAVAFAPIELGGELATFDDCSFVGDCEMLTLYGHQAAVRDCSFEFRNEGGLWGKRPIGNDTWMLALEAWLDHPKVERCTFVGEGAGTGLVINDRTSDLVDLSFSGLDVGVWVHKPDPFMTWADLRSELVFDGTCTVEYLGTTEVRLALGGDDAPEPWDDDYSRWRRWSIPDLPGLDYFYFPQLVTNWVIYGCFPVTIVTPEGGLYEVEELRAFISPQWSNGKYVTIYPSMPSHNIWFEADEVPQNQYDNIEDFTALPGLEPGTLDFGLMLVNELTEYGDMYINVSVDGVLTVQIDLNTTDYNWSEAPVQWVNLTLDIPPGPHILNLTTGLVSTSWGDQVFEMGTFEEPVFRITDTDEAGDIDDWMASAEYPLLMVDPDVRVDGLDYLDTSTAFYSFIQVLMWDGSEIVFDRMEFDPDDWVILRTEGNGSLVIDRISAFWVNHHAGNCSMTIGDMECYYYEGEFSNVSLTFAEGWHDTILTVEANNGSIIHMEDIEVVAAQTGIGLQDSVCTISGCTFWGFPVSGVYLVGSGNSTFTVAGCGFVGTPLKVSFANGSDMYYITDCTFEEPGAYLALLLYYMALSIDENGALVCPTSGTVAGNRFLGEGAALVFVPPVRDSILGENELSDGARAYAAYYVEMQGVHWDYYEYGLITLDSLEFFRSIGITLESARREFTYLVDVTSDPMDGSDPGLVPVIVRRATSSSGAPRGPIVGFQNVAISSGMVTLQGIDWPSADDMVSELERTFPIEDNWWTD